METFSDCHEIAYTCLCELDLAESELEAECDRLASDMQALIQCFKDDLRQRIEEEKIKRSSSVGDDRSQEEERGGEAIDIA